MAVEFFSEIPEETAPLAVSVPRASGRLAVNRSGIVIPVLAVNPAVGTSPPRLALDRGYRVAGPVALEWIDDADPVAHRLLIGMFALDGFLGPDQLLLGAGSPLTRLAVRLGAEGPAYGELQRLEHQRAERG